MSSIEEIEKLQQIGGNTIESVDKTLITGLENDKEEEVKEVSEISSSCEDRERQGSGSASPVCSRGKSTQGSSWMSAFLSRRKKGETPPSTSLSSSPSSPSFLSKKQRRRFSEENNPSQTSSSSSTSLPSTPSTPALFHSLARDESRELLKDPLHLTSSLLMALKLSGSPSTTTTPRSISEDEVGTIEGLPNEVLMLIFSFLKREIDLFNVCLVCKRWKSLMDTDIIWQTILYRRYRRERGGAFDMVMASFREEQEQQALEFSESLMFGSGSASSSDRDTAAALASNSASSVDERAAWPEAYRSPTTFTTSPPLFSPTTSTGSSISSSLDENISHRRQTLLQYHLSSSPSTSNSTSTSPSYSTPPTDLNWKRFYLTRLKQDRLWKLSKLGPQGTLIGHTEEIRCIALLGSRVITGSLDRSIRVWDSTNYSLLNTLHNNPAGVLCLQAVSTKNSEKGTRVITGNSDRTIKVWNIDSGLCTNTIHGHTGEVECLHVEDRFLVTGSRDTTVKVWDSNNYACLMTLEGHRAPVNCIQVGGRTIVSASADRTIKVWDLGTGVCLRTLTGKSNVSKQANILPSRQKGILCLQFNADSIVVGTGDSYLEMYDLDSLKLVRSTRGHNGPVTCLKYDEDKMVTGGRDNAVKLWDWNMWKVVHTLTATTARPGYEHGHRGAVTCIDFNKNLLVTGSNDKTSIIWAPGSNPPRRVTVPLGPGTFSSSSSNSGIHSSAVLLETSFSPSSSSSSPSSSNNPIIPMTFGSMTSTIPVITTTTATTTSSSSSSPSRSPSPSPSSSSSASASASTSSSPFPTTMIPSSPLVIRTSNGDEGAGRRREEEEVATPPTYTSASSSSFPSPFMMTYHHTFSSTAHSGSERRLSFDRECSEFELNLPSASSSSSSSTSLHPSSSSSSSASSSLYTTATTTTTTTTTMTTEAITAMGSGISFELQRCGSERGSELAGAENTSSPVFLSSSSPSLPSSPSPSSSSSSFLPLRSPDGGPLENVLELLNAEEEGSGGGNENGSGSGRGNGSGREGDGGSRMERFAGFYGYSEEDENMVAPLSTGEKDKCILC